jgi:ribosome-associated toxin RatA of RatAB toxin-antitoxin module
MDKSNRRSGFSIGYLLISTLSVFAVSSRLTLARVPDSPREPITLVQNDSSREGDAVLQGSNGNYTGRVTVRGPLTTIWAVLTDYDNFSNFMPNVIESRLLQSEGNIKFFEQVQLFQILLASRKARVKLEVTEKPRQLIQFRVVEGEVKSLKGSWKIERRSGDLYLLTHQVSVEPDIRSDFNRQLFYAVYEDTLERTLTAVKQEVDKRSGR